MAEMFFSHQTGAIVHRPVSFAMKLPDSYGLVSVLSLAGAPHHRPWSAAWHAAHEQLLLATRPAASGSGCTDRRRRDTPDSVTLLTVLLRPSTGNMPDPAFLPADEAWWNCGLKPERD